MGFAALIVDEKVAFVPCCFAGSDFFAFNGDMHDDKLLSKIAALLRQAEGTDNVHEAQTFTEAAQRLATAASIDLAVARAHGDQTQADQPVQRTIVIGEAGKRGLKTYIALFVAIASPNDVVVDVSHNSTFVIAYGYSNDIDAVEALYGSLVVHMVRAGEAFIRSGAHKKEAVLVRREVKEGYRTRIVTERKPIAAVTARLNFHQAFAARIHTRLEAAKRHQMQTMRDHSDDRGASMELALVNKELEVRRFHTSASQARGSWRGTTTAGRSRAAMYAGDREGRNARLGESRTLGNRRALE